MGPREDPRGLPHDRRLHGTPDDHCSPLPVPLPGPTCRRKAGRLCTTRRESRSTVFQTRSHAPRRGMKGSAEQTYNRRCCSHRTQVKNRDKVPDSLVACLAGPHDQRFKVSSPHVKHRDRRQRAIHVQYHRFLLRVSVMTPLATRDHREFECRHAAPRYLRENAKNPFYSLIFSQQVGL